MEQLKWEDARDACERDGLVLAAVFSDDDARAMMLATGGGSQHMWVGASDRDVEGQWTWLIDGSTFPPTANPSRSYEAWGNGERMMPEAAARIA